MIYNYVIIINETLKNYSILLAMELGEKTLKDDIESRRKISKNFADEDIRNFVKIFVNEFAKLEMLGINHADIKPANFLLVNGKWKISDFGIA